MRRNRMQEQWQSYKREVLPSNAPAVQVQECRRAFYAGALAAFTTYQELGDDSVSEDEGVKVLADLIEELSDFGRFVREGRA